MLERAEQSKGKASRGSYFGAECLLGNSPHRTSAVAESDCRLLRLDRTSFDAVVLSQRDEDELDEEDEDDEDEDGATCLPGDLVDIFILSDSTGESASASVRTAAQQFQYCSGSTCAASRTTVFRFIRSESEIRKIIASAKEKKAMLAEASADLVSVGRHGGYLAALGYTLTLRSTRSWIPSCTRWWCRNAKLAKSRVAKTQLPRSVKAARVA